MLFRSNDAVFTLKRAYHNNFLEDLVLGKNDIEKMTTSGTKLIRKYNPAHFTPTSRIGRAHMFAPEKRLGNIKIDTLWFNTLVLWIMSLIFYFTLLTNLFRAINKYLERFKFRRLAKRIGKYIPR